MNIYIESSSFHIFYAIMTPLQAGIIIGAMAAAAAIVLAVILHRCRIADRRIEAARSSASSADALAKAVGMLDSLQNQCVCGKTDETSDSGECEKV